MKIQVRSLAIAFAIAIAVAATANSSAVPINGTQGGGTSRDDGRALSGAAGLSHL